MRPDLDLMCRSDGRMLASAAQPAVGADRRATVLLHASGGGRRPLNCASLGSAPRMHLLQ